MCHPPRPGTRAPENVGGITVNPSLFADMIRVIDKESLLPSDCVAPCNNACWAGPTLGKLLKACAEGFALVPGIPAVRVNGELLRQSF